MFSLDDIRIASPCQSDWDQMYGDERRRFCKECKLNVYNLSDMTRDEAERFVMNSEGRLCVRFFRRKDGTILTQDCPVGWRAIKRRASRVAVAMSSAVFAFFAGLLSVRAVDSGISLMPMGDVAPPVLEKKPVIVMGDVSDFTEMRGKPVIRPKTMITIGRLERVERFSDVNVKAWVK